MSDFLPPEVQKRIEAWQKPPFDDKTIERVKELQQKDPQALIDQFYTTIAFGTGGMRGVMDVGTNRMNIYTIRRATQGLANYILKSAQEKPHRVFIGYDCRHHSHTFAMETASVLAANGIEAHVTKELRPTPFVSFGCRHLKCTAAVMITASHNPSEYNGYKVYWSDGAQVVPPHDKGIIAEVNQISSEEEIKTTSDQSLIHEVSSDVDEAYFKALAKLPLFPKEDQEEGSNLKLLYSNLHGTGVTLMPEALKRWGFTSLAFVDDQMKPDGNFPKAPSPNPEQKEALKEGCDRLLKEGHDLFFATDPDADRIGVVASHRGKAVILNGNQVASICLYFLCQTLKKTGMMPKKGAAVTTIVSTPLFEEIARSFGVTCFEVLTGFKYIGEKIHEWETSDDGYTFLFGAEESLGYLYGTQTRDKDAMVAACLLSEIALQEKKEGRTLVDLLHDIYKQFGLFYEGQRSVHFGTTKEDALKMEEVMEHLRKNPPTVLAGQKVLVVEDYKSGKTSKNEPLSLPKSNVLLFRMENKHTCVIRPSGTEPKIKIYGMVFDSMPDLREEAERRCQKSLETLLEEVEKKHLKGG